MEGNDGEAMFRQACVMGLEGIVSKRAASRYSSGKLSQDLGHWRANSDSTARQ